MGQRTRVFERISGTGKAGRFSKLTTVWVSHGLAAFQFVDEDGLRFFQIKSGVVL